MRKKMVAHKEPNSKLKYFSKTKPSLNQDPKDFANEKSIIETFKPKSSPLFEKSTIVKISLKQPTSSKTTAPSCALKRPKAISEEPLSKKYPTLINEETKSSNNEQEFGKDESTHSSKSHDYTLKETIKASGIPLKSFK